MNKAVDKLLKTHPGLTHSEDQRVSSHVQRVDGDWIQHIVMIEGHDVPFKFKRKQHYKSLKGTRVNLTYYPDTELVVGVAFEVMRVVRIKVA